MKIETLIITDPEICHGKPTFRGTRIPIFIVLELLESGQTYPQILAGYPQLTVDHIKAALHFAAQTMENWDKAANA